MKRADPADKNTEKKPGASDLAGEPASLAPMGHKAAMTAGNAVASLVPGVDYILENGFMVFTKAYHIKRGSCCGSGCRNCPYDHEKCPRATENGGGCA